MSIGFGLSPLPTSTSQPHLTMATNPSGLVDKARMSIIFSFLAISVTIIIVTEHLQAAVVESFPFQRSKLPHDARRRFGYATAFKATSSSDALSSSNNEVYSQANNEVGSQENKCPFVKPFQRYQINLPRVVEEEKKKPLLNLLFPEFQDKRKREAAEKKFCDVHMIWCPNQDGAAALATLYEAAVSTSTEQRDVVVALPNAQPRVLIYWKEIVEWSNTLTTLEGQKISSDDDSKDGGNDFELEYHDDPVPIMRIIRRKQHQHITLPPETVSTVNKRTQSWVQRILVDLSICPFTKSVKYSGQGLADLGVPVGRIAYHASGATNLIGIQADVWRAINDMLEAGPSSDKKQKGISSILLAAPSFDNNFDLWAGPVFCMLEAGVLAAGAEKVVGVVCFHPNYATPDGSTFPGFGQMHSLPRLQQWCSKEEPSSVQLPLEEVAAGGAWQRRTPHATINVLRADQLEAAEGRRSSSSLYNENIRRLVGPRGVGSEKLLQDLEHERQMGVEP